MDPVLFDNFITTTGDDVSAKFRAFKFPETNYVLFQGTVDVCLDKCQGVSKKTQLALFNSSYLVHL